jgi:hypothetical protein
MSTTSETPPQLPAEPETPRPARKPAVSGMSVLIKIIVFMMVVPAVLILVSKLFLG